jgi:hypothetical protein
MRSKSQARAIRKIVASLLDSDLTLRELRSVAENFSGGSSFAWELGRFLHETCIYLTDLEGRKGGEFDSANLEETAYDIIQRRRMSKRHVADLIAASMRDSPDSWLNSSLTVREMLAQFFDKVSESEAELFLDLLRGGQEADQYLTGIVQRR